MNKKQMGVNLIAGLVSNAVTLAISLFLTPYLVEHLGDEAYGYIGLSDQFLTIATIFTTALNSMANRFILLAYQKQDKQKVLEYYSSLFVGGAILAGVFFVGGMFVAGSVEHIFKVTPSLLPAVKLTFAISIVNFCVITLMSIFTTAAFIKNRLSLSSMGELVANLVKALFLVTVFTLLDPQLYYARLGGLLYTVVLYGIHMLNTRRLLPELKIRLRFAKLKAIKELVVSGMWNSFSQIIQLLMVGMDLALANWLLDERAMGLLSISNMLTMASNSIIGVVVGIFSPVLFRTYAQRHFSKLRMQTAQTVRLECAVMFVPLAGLFVFSPYFYSLWMPYKSQADIMLLAAITAVKLWEQFARLTTEALRLNFTMYNQLRSSVIVRLLFSVFNLPLVVLLVTVCPSYTGSVLLIAGISSVLYSIYYWAVEPWLVSRVTGEAVKAYYQMILREILLFACLVGAFSAIYGCMPAPVGWASFLLLAGCAGAFGYLIVWMVGLNKSDRETLHSMLFEAIRKRFPKDPQE